MRRWAGVAAMVGLVAAGVSAEDDGTSWRDHVTLSASLRVRGEFVDWFQPPPGIAPSGAERYDFFGSQLRVGARVLFPHVEVGVEVQDTRLAGLPDDATLAPPQGSLGTGALYFLFTPHRSQGETFLKQGFVTLRRAGVSATVGRFDYRDGLETVPADPTLAFVKRTRIAERLVGPFEFTQVTRSFDGGRLVYDDALWNVTALAVRPTRGGFEVSANRDVDHVGIAGLAFTLKRLPVPGPPVDLRLFYLYYDDRRRDVLKVDNRPLPVRSGDHDPIAIQTIGAHGLTALDAGPGIVDLLAWAVAQSGDWGTLQQSAWAYALEAGYQLPRLPGAPWLRVGIDRSSGDDDPNDGAHGTFFQLLPTARTYAQLPFFNLMNTQDVFTSLILRPHPIVTLRTDYHWLRVTEGRDLWYAGGGAQNADLFGYSGSPALGRHDLAQLVDLAISITVTRQVTFGGYFGHAFGGGVVGQSFVGRDTNYGFVEMTLRY
ncbi:MAG: alginate export family protein [Candidatus Binatia bacterium]